MSSFSLSSSIISSVSLRTSLRTSSLGSIVSCTGAAGTIPVAAGLGLRPLLISYASCISSIVAPRRNAAYA